MPVRFRCKNCKAVVEIPSSHYGKNAFCPQCGDSLQVPQPVRHECDKCGRDAILDGKQGDRKCPCGGRMVPVQMFVSKPSAAAVSAVWQVQDIDGLVAQEVDAPSLIILTGPRAGTQVPLPGDRLFFIGSDSGCDLQISNRLTSARHCHVEQKDNLWLLVNEQRDRAAVLDGEPVPEKATLTDGAIIAVGVDLLAFKLPPQ